MLNLLTKSCRQHCRIYTTTHTFQILQFVRGTREIRFHFINNIIIVFNSVLLCFDHCQLALEVRYVRNQRTDTVILEHKTYCANILMRTNLEGCFQFFVLPLNLTKLLSHLLVE